MKKIILILFLFFLTSCSANSDKNENNMDEGIAVSTYIDNEMKEKAEKIDFMAELSADYLDYNYLNETMDHLIVGTVVSLDQGIMYEGGMFPYTLGNILVQETFYGDDLKGQTIHFGRGGGMLSYTQYDAASPVSAVEKRDKLRLESGITDFNKDENYINMKFENDIEIEAGKTYLMYISKSPEIDSYEIFGLEAGLREINVPQVTRSSMQSLDISTLQVKDNVKDEYVSLQDYLNETLPK